MSKRSRFTPFTYAEDSPLAREHAAVSLWVEDAHASRGQYNWYQEVDLKMIASGQSILNAKPDEACKYVLAAIEQARHWDGLVEMIRADGTSDLERDNPHQHPDWEKIWGRRRQAVAVLGALLRRSLPITREEAVVLLQWCIEERHLGKHTAPLGHIVQTLKRFVAGGPPDDELRRMLRQFASRLRSCYDKDEKRLGTVIEQLCGESEEPETSAKPAKEWKPPAKPAWAGTECVLERLKCRLGMLAPASPAAVTPIGPDTFPLDARSPLRPQHVMLSALLDEALSSSHFWKPDPGSSPAARAIAAVKPSVLGCLILAVIERRMHCLDPDNDDDLERNWRGRYASGPILTWLFKQPFELHRHGLFDVLLYLSAASSHGREGLDVVIDRLISQAEKEAAVSPLADGERYVLSLFRASLMPGLPLGAPSDVVKRLSLLIDDGMSFFLAPGEVWSDAVNRDLSCSKASERKAWTELLSHTSTATAARPTARWLNQAKKAIDAVGGKTVQQAVTRWMPLIAQGRTTNRLPAYPGDTRGSADTMNDENATCLRGLLWLMPLLPRREELVRAISGVALSAYKKVPGVGPRAVKVGNAAVYALSQIGSTDAVGQLAMVKVRVKFGTAQKEIEKAFHAAAAALNLPREEIEELGVPSYGLEQVGHAAETLDDYRAELAVSGSDAKLNWFDAQGKALKAVPAKIKREYKEELTELQQSLKDIQSMLPAQRDRIDSMFLLQKSWAFAVWQQRYLDHPLVGTIARRLIWCVDGTPVLFIDGKATDVHGDIVKHGETAEITLWHPVGRVVEEIVGWRRRLEDLEITQPFKQAHREIYLLTDAERRTNTYSNRFAAHILRQHQFHALCATRGWKNKLRLMVDDSVPPAARHLPQWGLRAEFWIEGIGEDYGTDTNESGVFLRLSTDQVRFYRSEAAENYAHASGGGYTAGAAGPGADRVNEPLPMEEIPALVFSEVMRDVDLFVGVASVGNDPTWQDGGPGGRYQTYWQSYSFGELSGSATTRKEVLERLVPRLKIGSRCSFSDRFLVVRGDLRTYKIHLGSSNILMDPNDQYLCIVPDARARAAQDNLFLPFEGDNRLSIILSKALLLADDAKIKDTTITRQIKEMSDT